MAAIMVTNPQPPLPPEVLTALEALQEEKINTKTLQGELNAAKTHYIELLGYFKHLVWVTGGALTIIVVVGGYVFHSNLQDTLKDIKANATQLATTEAKNRVSEAFEEKNIKAEIADVAKDKIGKVTDKMIEQQLTSKLQPIQQRIILIGRISECEARIHAGFRSGLKELTTILDGVTDPDVRQFAQSTLTNTSEGYDTFWQPPMKGRLPIDSVRMAVEQPGQQVDEVVKDLGGVVRVINKNQNLNTVAVAIIAFREMTGYKDVKMFDFKAVNAWCTGHEPQCK
jgi:hypothetical protein